jgi:hypothetical protein
LLHYEAEEDWFLEMSSLKDAVEEREVKDGAL